MWLCGRLSREHRCVTAYFEPSYLSSHVMHQGLSMDGWPWAKVQLCSWDCGESHARVHDGGAAAGDQGATQIDCMRLVKQPILAAPGRVHCQSYSGLKLHARPSMPQDSPLLLRVWDVARQSAGPAMCGQCRRRRSCWEHCTVAKAKDTHLLLAPQASPSSRMHAQEPKAQPASCHSCA